MNQSINESINQSIRFRVELKMIAHFVFVPWYSNPLVPDINLVMTTPTVPDLVLSTRASVLALVQANHIASLLVAFGTCRLLPLTTVPDKVHNSVHSVDPMRPSHGMETKEKEEQDTLTESLPLSGIFTRELDHSLLTGTSHMAVHSLKDLPTVLHPSLALIITARHPTPDCLVGKSLEELNRTGCDVARWRR